MIDGFIRKKTTPNNIHPHDQQHFSRIVVGDHSNNRFVPPQHVAASEEVQPNTTTAGSLPPPNKRSSPKSWFLALSKKQKILATVGGAVVFAGLIIGNYFLFFAEKPAPPSKPVAQVEAVPEEPPKPTTVESNLSGLQVDAAVNERPVTAVMIENSLDARPQSGLNQAGVVFEAVAEGGITRFVALFQDTQPDYVGPVRSARPYYIQWALGFDATYAHAGGSPEGLANITQWGVKDLNHNATAFWRVNNRTAPHNLYTSIAKLREYASAKGYGKSNFTPFARKAETPSAVPNAKTINFNISSANYNVQYGYDTTTNSYKRSVGGKIHTDEKSGAQLAPKVVAALIMPQGLNGKYNTYATIGSGQLYIFQDGIVTTGTWKKDSNNANFSFTDGSGAPIKLNPGQTWFTALGGTDRVSFTP